jgi:hypothetical protein
MHPHPHPHPVKAIRHPTYLTRNGDRRARSPFTCDFTTRKCHTGPKPTAPDPAPPAAERPPGATAPVHIDNPVNTPPDPAARRGERPDEGGGHATAQLTCTTPCSPTYRSHDP